MDVRRPLFAPVTAENSRTMQLAIRGNKRDVPTWQEERGRRGQSKPLVSVPLWCFARVCLATFVAQLALDADALAERPQVPHGINKANKRRDKSRRRVYTLAERTDRIDRIELN